MATRIIKIGMDVHSTNYTLCALESRWNEPPLLHARIQVEPETQFVLKFIETIQEKIGEECEIICGYEAGCLGDSLYRDLKKENIECVIMAPTTMSKSPIKGKKKSDYRDANDIAELLISGGYHAVYVLTENDAAVKEYIRMRDDHKSMVKQTKQRINALVLRSGKQFSGSSWTGAHIEWLKKLEFGHAATREILNEYLVTLDMLEGRMQDFEQRIEEFGTRTEYVEKVKKLSCFLGIKTYTALSLIVETGDFQRFTKATQFASFLGLVPGEHSSGESDPKMGITKAGNNHLRRLLIESADSICRGQIGHKSKALRARQNGNNPQVIAFADKANVRLRKKYYHLLRKGKNKNVTKTAIARELSCFVWGMMTNNIEPLLRA